MYFSFLIYFHLFKSFYLNQIDFEVINTDVHDQLYKIDHIHDQQLIQVNLTK